MDVRPVGTIIPDSDQEQLMDTIEYQTELDNVHACAISAIPRFRSIMSLRNDGHASLWSPTDIISFLLSFFLQSCVVPVGISEGYGFNTGLDFLAT